LVLEDIFASLHYAKLNLSGKPIKEVA